MNNEQSSRPPALVPDDTTTTTSSKKRTSPSTNINDLVKQFERIMSLPPAERALLLAELSPDIQSGIMNIPLDKAEKKKRSKTSAGSKSKKTMQQELKGKEKEEKFQGFLKDLKKNANHWKRADATTQLKIWHTEFNVLDTEEGPRTKTGFASFAGKIEKHAQTIALLRSVNAYLLCRLWLRISEYCVHDKISLSVFISDPKVNIRNLSAKTISGYINMGRVFEAYPTLMIAGASIEVEE